MNKKYIVRQNDEERDELTELVSKGKAAAYKIKHANILLSIDADGPGWTDEQAAKAFHCHTNTVVQLRQRFVELGLQAALERKKQLIASRQRILDGAREARLITLACSEPPLGRAKWTLKLLADKLIELEIVESISPQTVSRTLKKTNSNRICTNVG